MPTILITGANRGLGLEFCRQFAAQRWRILACCREPRRADELHALSRSHRQIDIHQLDVGDFAAIDELSGVLKDDSIDVLVNNAGIYDASGRAGFGRLDYDGWLRTLRVNTLAPVKMAEAFVEQLARSQRRLLVSISSGMGSISSDGAGAYAYRTSKAALNMAMRSLMHDLSSRNIGVLIVSPGWVRTDMGGAGAPLSVAQSVTGMRRVIEEFEPQLSGRFLSHDGGELAW